MAQEWIYVINCLTAGKLGNQDGDEPEPCGIRKRVAAPCQKHARDIEKDTVDFQLNFDTV